jgi:hypothetical protein
MLRRVLRNINPFGCTIRQVQFTIIIFFNKGYFMQRFVSLKSISILSRTFVQSFFLIVIVLLAGCTSTQFTMYKPSDSAPGWRITVDKKPIGEVFLCSINDSLVIEESFGLFSNNFEKDGTYSGKPVKMSGFRTTHSTTDSKGAVTTTSTYQIRVFIDEREVGKFDF